MIDFKKLSKSISKDIAESKRQLVAFDCETTGSALFHGDLPFMVCMTFEDKTQLTWEWFVDPNTRKVQVDPTDLCEIISYLNNEGYLFIGHNIKFDVRCIEKARESLSIIEAIENGEIPFPDFDPISFLRRSHDTHCMSHALDNLGSHGLKDLAVRYLDIPEDDVSDLKTQVELSRKIATKLNWKIANAANCPFITRAPDGGWWVVDMWLPAMVTTTIEQFSTVGNLNNLCKKYCLRDTERTLLLFVLLREELQKANLWDQYLRNQKVLPAIYDMERHGVSINMPLLKEEQNRFRQEAEDHLTSAINSVGYSFNINAPEQVAEILKSKFNIYPQRETKKGNGTINKDELEILYTKYKQRLDDSSSSTILVDNEVNGSKIAKFVPRYQIEKLLQFILDVMSSKKCLKAANSDLKGYALKALRYSILNEVECIFEMSHYLHPSINCVGTDTIRTSMSDPNGQNIGKGKSAFNEEIKALDLSLRKIFGPVRGRKWYSIDYSQLQLVIAAYTSGDKAVMKLLEDGGDLHLFMQERIAHACGWKFNPDDDAQRTIAKNTNFGFWFGAGEKKINKTTHTTGLYPVLCKLFPNAPKQIQKDITEVRLKGYISASGYRLYVPPEIPYAATVYRVQGWEGVIAKKALYLTHDYCYRYPEGDVHLILLVHDELVFDAPYDDRFCLSNICQLMELAGKTESIPCHVDAKVITTNWSQGIKVDWKTYADKTIPF